MFVKGVVLSPNLFKIFINDLPDYLTEYPDPAYINNQPLNCLMYADDIVLLSTSSTGLQDKLDKLSKYCNDWCLDVNVSKTKVLIFNKPGKQVQNNFFFNDICLENVKHYCYLGVYFSASGIFNCAQDDIFKKSIKATFKLTKSIISGEPSINTSLHLYDHMIKPIVVYGSEIWEFLKQTVLLVKRTACFHLKKYTRAILQINHKQGI